MLLCKNVTEYIQMATSFFCCCCILAAICYTTTFRHKVYSGDGDGSSSSSSIHMYKCTMI